MGTIYSFCYECAAFAEHSCEKYERLANRYARRRVDVRANLREIQAGHLDEWLVAQEQRWRCPACGRPIGAWYDNCKWCGKEKT